MSVKDGEHPWGDAGQLVALGAFLVVWAGDSFALRLSTSLADVVPLPVRLACLGVALAAAIWLARSGHAVVPRSGRPDRLVVAGAFRYVRHPLYLASLLTYLGLSLSTGSLLSLLLLGGIFALHDLFASYEETQLEARYGAAYLAYRDRTGKWLPHIGRGRGAGSG